MKYRIKDVVPGNDPSKLRFVVEKYDDEDSIFYEFEVDGHGTKEDVLLRVDNAVKCVCVDYMDFKDQRDIPKDI